MKILLDNVNINSTSGPNSFGRRLMHHLNKLGHSIGTNVIDPDVQLSFITSTQRKAKIALRLDGIYFNSKQDWQKLNSSIKDSFENSEIVIYQSHFNQKLTEKFFGYPKKSVVINNGTCLEAISKIPPLKNNLIENFSEIWCCSSSWRPHKRLKDNIGYFLQNAPNDSCLIVAGENPDYILKHPRIFYTGQLSWENCISLYKRSKVFIHLAFLDHCPNVVVDARACGCHIIVSSSGGTKEISGLDSQIIEDINWDMSPLDLYSPPPLDYSKVFKNNLNSDIDINSVACRYLQALGTI